MMPPLNQPPVSRHAHQHAVRPCRFVYELYNELACEREASQCGVSKRKAVVAASSRQDEASIAVSRSMVQQAPPSSTLNTPHAHALDPIHPNIPP